VSPARSSHTTLAKSDSGNRADVHTSHFAVQHLRYSEAFEAMPFFNRSKDANKDDLEMTKTLYWVYSTAFHGGQYRGECDREYLNLSASSRSCRLSREHCLDRAGAGRFL
jgi:hypothetical protein